MKKIILTITEAAFLSAILFLFANVANTQECVSDDGIQTIEGFRVLRVHDRSFGGITSLIDVETARGAYWSGPGPEGVLFTTDEGGIGAIGRMDADGNFVDYLVPPVSTFFPRTAYLEYAYDDLLYACDTVGGNDIWRILPDGSVQFVADYPNCEGIIFGDRGDGINALYVSSWTAGTVDRVDPDGTIVPIASGFPIYVTDLAIPDAASSFASGLYAVQQSGPGIFHIDLAGTVTLPYAYGGNLTGGEEGSFADPGSVFGDALYHLNFNNQVQRLFADGTAEIVAQGGGLDFGDHTMGGVFSTDGRFYYFTNEATTIWRLEACSVAVVVDIDIKPGSDPNCFNINGHGVIPVAILGSGTFDVSNVDQSSLSFGGLNVRVRGNKGPLCGLEDTNSDVIYDLVCHFEDDASNWNVGGGTATLTGMLLDGTDFEGTGSICVVP